MHIEKHSWYSPNVEKEMTIVRYGNWGPPMIYYPTSGGGHSEFDYYGMQWDTQEFIENGKIQYFAIDGYNWQSFYNNRISPAERIQKHMAYERYVYEEMIPFVLHTAKNDFIGCMGCSFGAYHAMNSILKRPDLFKLSLSMGGVFDISGYMGGYYDMNVYFNNPVDYVPNMHDQEIIKKFGRENYIILLSGANDKFLDGTTRMHDILEKKHIPHHYEIWDPPCDHHEFWWKKQLPYIVNKYYNV